MIRVSVALDRNSATYFYTPWRAGAAVFNLAIIQPGEPAQFALERLVRERRYADRCYRPDGRPRV